MSALIFLTLVPLGHKIHGLSIINECLHLIHLVISSYFSPLLSLSFEASNLKNVVLSISFPIPHVHEKIKGVMHLILLEFNLC